MVNVLKNICENLNIKLVYTNNKFSILSCSVYDGIPLIRVHSLFKGCSEDIAKAIINYYTNAENTEVNLNIIKDYADEKFNIKSYKIMPPNSEFYDTVIKTLSPQKNEESEKTNMIEYIISSMVKKNFCGEELEIKQNDSIKIDEDDFIEINIVIAPFNT